MRREREGVGGRERLRDKKREKRRGRERKRGRESVRERERQRKTKREKKRREVRRREREREIVLISGRRCHVSIMSEVNTTEASILFYTALFYLVVYSQLHFHYSLTQNGCRSHCPGT